MSILGIENRTENWQTVQHFHGLANDAKVRLVHRLLKPFGDEPRVEPGDIQVELFWEGMRDYIDQRRRTGESDLSPQEFASRYERIFGGLGERVANFRAEQHPYKFDPLKPHNYDASGENHTALFSNLSKTEIDIVLQNPGHIFIGEAKHESKLGSAGKLILVHQLIRQYVMAKILVDLVPAFRQKKVVPFVVGDGENLASLKNTVQVKFMVQQGRVEEGWLKEENVLSWKDIQTLVKGDS